MQPLNERKRHRRFNQVYGTPVKLLDVYYGKPLHGLLYVERKARVPKPDHANARGAR